MKKHLVSLSKIYSLKFQVLILKMSKQTKKSSRNWTKAETNLFCEILVDPINNFMQTLEQKALKKNLSKGSLWCNCCWNEAMKAEPFQSRNSACRKNKGDLVPLDVDHKRLQTKYNKIKQQWRQISEWFWISAVLM